MITIYDILRSQAKPINCNSLMSTKATQFREVMSPQPPKSGKLYGPEIVNCEHEFIFGGYSYFSCKKCGYSGRELSDSAHPNNYITPKYKVGDYCFFEKSNYFSETIIEITNVRIDRLQNVTEDDLVKLDVTGYEFYNTIKCAWDYLHPSKENFSKNPYVFIYDYKIIDIDKIKEVKVGIDSIKGLEFYVVVNDINKPGFYARPANFYRSLTGNSISARIELTTDGSRYHVYIDNIGNKESIEEARRAVYYGLSHCYACKILPKSKREYLGIDNNRFTKLDFVKLVWNVCNPSNTI